MGRINKIQETDSLTTGLSNPSRRDSMEHFNSEINCKLDINYNLSEEQTYKCSPTGVPIEKDYYIVKVFDSSIYNIYNARTGRFLNKNWKGSTYSICVKALGKIFTNKELGELYGKGIKVKCSE
jgi:hypothetical protein